MLNFISFLVLLVPACLLGACVGAIGSGSSGGAGMGALVLLSVAMLMSQGGSK